MNTRSFKEITGSIAKTMNSPSTLKFGVLQSGGKTFRGFHAEIFKILLETLNFTIQWVQPRNKTYGVKDAQTGEWIGLVGLLATKQADVAVLPLSVSSSRRTVITFSVSFESYALRLYMKKPGPSASWNTFLAVFEFKYWILLIVAGCVCSVSLAWHFITIDWDHLQDTSNILYNIGSAISATCLAFGIQDMSLARTVSNSSPISLRMLIMTICVCGVLNYYFYTGGLISFVMVQKFEMSINNLEDILKNPSHQLLVRRGYSDEAFLRDSLDITTQKVWVKTVTEDNPIHTYEEGEIRIKQEARNILFAEDYFFETYYDSFPCDVVSPQQRYFPHSGAYGLRNDFAYIKLFDMVINQMKEA